jgi:ABC-type glycerol-3-phosphate transport system substrate-binding protein
VEFVYPSVTAVVPANIGIIANASHPQAAKAFIDFVLSEEGQLLLLDPKIRRLPVLPSIYAKAPADYPNPFKNPSMGSVKFDVDLSKTRYNLVNSLFDAVISFRHEDLKAAWKAIHGADAKVSASRNERAEKLLSEAKKIASSVPITEKESVDPNLYKAFKKLEKGQKAAGKMAESEQRWDDFARTNYAKAADLAAQALKAAK